MVASINMTYTGESREFEDPRTETLYDLLVFRDHIFEALTYFHMKTSKGEELESVDAVLCKYFLLKDEVAQLHLEGSAKFGGLNIETGRVIYDISGLVHKISSRFDFSSLLSVSSLDGEVVDLFSENFFEIAGHFFKKEFDNILGPDPAFNCKGCSNLETKYIPEEGGPDPRMVREEAYYSKSCGISSNLVEWGVLASQQKVKESSSSMFYYQFESVWDELRESQLNSLGVCKNQKPVVDATVYNAVASLASFVEILKKVCDPELTIETFLESVGD
ncbi:hypothetical protein HN587_00920 [Candidatus Woesearchaeota archaeon]|jgi:hypothetical protein|nr:hypothetical protein [Candidatus Woesearchaeota archaeon]